MAYCPFLCPSGVSRSAAAQTLTRSPWISSGLLRASALYKFPSCHATTSFTLQLVIKISAGPGTVSAGDLRTLLAGLHPCKPNRHLHRANHGSAERRSQTRTPRGPRWLPLSSYQPPPTLSRASRSSYPAQSLLFNFTLFLSIFFSISVSFGPFLPSVIRTRSSVDDDSIASNLTVVGAY